MPVYDTYSSVRRLMEAGIPEEQAVAIVREQFQFVESIATKDDLESLRNMLTGDIRALAAEIADIRAEMKARDARLIQYITGLAIAMTGTIVTLLKVL